MKKILFLLLMLIPISVKANTNYYIAIQDDADITYYPFTSRFEDWVYSFELSPFDNYEITAPNYINNLAYLSYFDSLEEYQVTIQTLIWENIHPEYNFYVVDSNYEKFDNKEQITRIKQNLKSFNLNSNFMNATYELNPNEELLLTSPSNLNTYNINSDILLDNFTIRLNYELKGTYTIEFTNKELDIKDGIIYGHEFFSDPFKITVNVDNYHDININTYYDNKLIDNNILIYDIKGNLVKNVTDTKPIRLKEQQYKFVDAQTREEKILIINENIQEVNFNHYNINGIKTDMPITKVCRDNNCFYFSLKNDIYIFDPPLLNGYYDIYSNDLKVTYNLNNQDNYINDSTNGLLYFIEYQNEIISKPPDKEEKPDYTVDDSQVSINIPDTGISQILLDEHIIVIKKKEFEY